MFIGENPIHIKVENKTTNTNCVTVAKKICNFWFNAQVIKDW